MTELRRTNNCVGVLRAEREFLELRSYEFVPIVVMSADSVRFSGSLLIEGPPL